MPYLIAALVLKEFLKGINEFQDKVGVQFFNNEFSVYIFVDDDWLLAPDSTRILNNIYEARLLQAGFIFCQNLQNIL